MSRENSRHQESLHIRVVHPLHLVDLVMLHVQLSHMQVKTAELKANLSRYVRQVRETGEPIEILLRDETVAYLTPASTPSRVAPEEKAEQIRLEKAFSDSGLTCEWASQRQPVQPSPVSAADGLTDVNSVAAIRAEKDW